MCPYVTDATMAGKDISTFRSVYGPIIREEAKKKLLSKEEIECLLLAYHKFLTNNGKREKFMTRQQFGLLYHSLFNISEQNIIDRMLSTIDPGSKKYITPQAFLTLLSLILKGTLEEQIAFCFKIYDTHGVGFLQKEKIRRICRNMLLAPDLEDLDVLTGDYVETLFRKMDLDRDGKISFEDYAESVRKNPGLLQFLGQCFPDDVEILTELFRLIRR